MYPLTKDAPPYKNSENGSKNNLSIFGGVKMCQKRKFVKKSKMGQKIENW